MDAFIISYFGEGRLSLLRQALHYQQLSVMLKNPFIENIYILAMHYNKHLDNFINVKPKDCLMLPHPQIHYIEHELVPPSKARNVLIKKFNQTNKPWALFADNDAYIDHRYHGTDCIKVIEHYANELSSYSDVLSLISPRHRPFHKRLEENQGSIDTHLWLKKINYLKTTLFFLKNKTYYNEDIIYFDEELTEMEDFEYQGRVLVHGNGIYQLQGVIMQDLGCSEEYSTLFVNKDRTSNWEELKNIIYNRYKKFGATLENGKIKWNRIRPMKLAHRPTDLWLPLNCKDEINGGKQADHSTFKDLFDYV